MSFQTFIALHITCLLSLSAGAAHASALDCSRVAGSLPNPALAAGTPNSANPIEHVIISMQENHSFDQYLGRLNVSGYGGEIDGVTPDLLNLDANGTPVHAYHETSRCIMDTDHSWNGEHRSWNNGKNDGFVKVNGRRVMAYYEKSEIPFYYALANQFAVADRYFCSAITQTFPNRFFMLTGTAFGHIKNDIPHDHKSFDQKTIFDTLDRYGVSWAYYSDSIGYLQLFQPLYLRDRSKIRKIVDYEHDLLNDNLPQVVFLESHENSEDEHPPADVALGESWESARISSLMQSPYWKSSVYFLMYDENGGFFDHVAPPEACKPEDGPGSDGFDHYGFRVPFFAISPYVKHHYVSHVTYDHTSVLKFIETKFNLPALTRRDANADGMMDLFDFQHPKLEIEGLPSAGYNARIRCIPRS